MRCVPSLLLATLALPACSAPAPDAERVEGATTLDTEGKARAQYDANLAFVRAYTPQCHRPDRGKAILLTAFGGFVDAPDNPTARVAGQIVPALSAPELKRTPEGVTVPSVRAAEGVVQLQASGDTRVCALILPVMWDLAAAIVAKEIDALRPSLVVMNGVRYDREPLFIELGAVNHARRADDTGDLMPSVSHEPVIDGLDASEERRGNLMSWRTVEAAAERARLQRADVLEDGTRFDAIVKSVQLAGMRVNANTYICNNTTYAVGYLMDHPGKPVSLMSAKPREDGAENEYVIKMVDDHRQTPRVFLHWPGDLRGEHVGAAAHVVRAILDAQLVALGSESDKPTRGTNALAHPATVAGE